jgi:hypothetical protein
LCRYKYLKTLLCNKNKTRAKNCLIILFNLRYKEIELRFQINPTNGICKKLCHGYVVSEIIKYWNKNLDFKYISVNQ